MVRDFQRIGLVEDSIFLLLLILSGPRWWGWICKMYTSARKSYFNLYENLITFDCETFKEAVLIFDDL